ncbi:MAG: hypothetical protein LBN20_02225, partial [Endomicrobium sp.]|nr:hypothetical protein [Endomicrobium sp.]
MKKQLVLSIIFAFLFTVNAHSQSVSVSSWSGFVWAYADAGYDIINLSNDINVGANIAALSLSSTTINGGGYFMDGASARSGFTFSAKTVLFKDIKLTSFSSTNGGAIYAAGNSIISIVADSFDIVFSSNKAASKPNDIYLTSSTLNLSAGANQIRMEGGAQAVFGSAIDWSNEAGGSWYLSGINSFSKMSAFNIGSASSITVENASWTFIHNTSQLNILNGSYLSFFNSTVVFSTNTSNTILNLSASSLFFLNSTVVFSTNAGNNGGVLYAAAESQVYFDSSNFKFSSNTALFNGGAIHSYQSTMSFLNSSAVFALNSAIDGGAVYFILGQWTMDNLYIDFSSNNAGQRGGGLYIDFSSVDFSSVAARFAGNNSSNYGAAAAFLSSTISFINSDISFFKNSARNGGALYIENSTIAFDGSTIIFSSNNVDSLGYGGAI